MTDDWGVDGNAARGIPTGILAKILEAGKAWLPMDDAPRDGTKIDILVGTERIIDAYWKHEEEAWCVDSYHMGPAQPFSVTWKPRGWMPVPELPEET